MHSLRGFEKRLQEGMPPKKQHEVRMLDAVNENCAVNFVKSTVHIEQEVFIMSNTKLRYNNLAPRLETIALDVTDVMSN